MEPRRFLSLSLVPQLRPSLTWALFSCVAAWLNIAMSEIYTDSFLRGILERTRRIAVVGVSMNPVRPSYYVARYLCLKNYEVIPVNPGHAGEMLFGQRVVASLSQIEGDVDMVDIFRRSEHVPPIVDEALGAFPGLQTLWMQIGVAHEDAAAKARARGVDVVMNHCPKIEYQRLFGELRMGGFNTGVISSKL
jgi:predicted CoA-binding protein